MTRHLPRGRPPKLYGDPFLAPGGRPARMSVRTVKERCLFKPVPRGKTGQAHHFVMLLKECAAMVYGFAAEDRRPPPTPRDPRLVALVREWRTFTGSRGRPSLRELTAFIIERAFEGAWEVWGVKRPTVDSDTFYRRYIRGVPGAVRDYRQVFREPRPWPASHRYTLVRDTFLAARGEAARRDDLLTGQDPTVTVVGLFTDDDQRKLLESKRRPRRRPQRT